MSTLLCRPQVEVAKANPDYLDLPFGQTPMKHINHAV
jgi:hypothetical protein